MRAMFVVSCGYPFRARTPWLFMVNRTDDADNSGLTPGWLVAWLDDRFRSVVPMC